MTVAVYHIQSNKEVAEVVVVEVVIVVVVVIEALELAVEVQPVVSV
jgi:hypothetical protein